jgi:hypothetical protein
MVGVQGSAALVAGGKLLDSPAIAIGIAEEHEPPRQGLVDVSDSYAGVAQLRLCGLDVVDDHLESLCRQRIRIEGRTFIASRTVA